MHDRRDPVLIWWGRTHRRVKPGLKRAWPAGSGSQSGGTAKDASFYRIPDQGRNNAALQPVSRIAAVHLSQHRDVGALGDAIEFDQRCAADGLRVVLKMWVIGDSPFEDSIFHGRP